MQNSIVLLYYIIKTIQYYSSKLFLIRIYTASMLKKLIISGFLVLIALLSYTQETWPAKVVINGDTFCISTIEQIRTVNKVFAERNYYHSLSDTALNIMYIYKNKCIQADALIENMKHQFNVCDSLSSIQLKNDSTYQCKIEVLTKQNKQLKTYGTAAIVTIVLLSLIKIFL